MQRENTRKKRHLKRKETRVAIGAPAYRRPMRIQPINRSFSRYGINSFVVVVVVVPHIQRIGCQPEKNYSRCPGLPASSLPVCPVYRCFFSCHPVTPVYRWYDGIPGWFIFSCLRSPSCCCTLPHTLLHTTQHNTLGVAGSSQHLPTHHAMCGRRIMPT